MNLVNILIVCVAILVIVLLYSLYKLYMFSMLIINLEDSIEECLEVLDSRYESMTEILEIPIFFDSMEVRRVINDIQLSRDSLVYVANKLTEKYGNKIEIKEKNDKENEEEV